MYYRKYSQILPISIEACWEFFSSPSNLKMIIPKHLQFELTTQQPNHIYEGQIITYTLKPLWNLRIEWVTEITHVQKYLYFIDEQRLGPYKFWHHEHWFQPVAQGVEITDMIYYQMPFGVLGNILHELKVKKDLDDIFAFRTTTLEKMFGTDKQL